ncbi:MAG: hypothetical protein ACRC8G_08910 [Plesiomonas shigelloides]
MKISNSKKQLAKIISKNGGWRDGASYAAQDKTDMRVDSYIEKPWINKGQTSWNGNYNIAHKFYAKTLLSNWHQTILSRNEYFHLYPAPDADGWIAWEGGECPIPLLAACDVKFSRGDEIESTIAGNVGWQHKYSGGDIIAYRLHKPTVEITCKSDHRTMEMPKPTIEQLAADYRSKLAIARQVQEEADSHRCGAEAALERLVAAGKAIGLALGVSDHYQELEIKDWMDWRVDDEVACISTPPGAKCFRWLSGTVSKILDNGVEVVFSDRKCCAYGGMVDKCFKFIRRP